jgi:hypothetical protein
VEHEVHKTADKARKTVKRGVNMDVLDTKEERWDESRRRAEVHSHTFMREVGHEIRDNDRDSCYLARFRMVTFTNPAKMGDASIEKQRAVLATSVRPIVFERLDEEFNSLRATHNSRPDGYIYY